MECKKCGQKTDNIYCDDCQKEFKKYIKNLEKKIKANPSNADLYYSIGCIKYELDSIADAIKDFDKAIELDPKNPDFYLKRGVCYQNYENDVSGMHDNDYYAAIEDFEEAIKLDSKYAEAYMEIGNSYIMLREIKKAKIYYEKALTINPYELNLYSEITWNLCDYRLYFEIKTFEKYLKRNPENLEGYKEEIDFLFGYLKGNQKEALSYYEYSDEAEEAEIEDNNYCYDRVIKDCEKIIEKEPNNGEIYFKRGYLCHYMLKENCNKALQDFNTAIKYSYCSELLYFARGYYNMELKNYLDAIEDYKQLLKLAPYKDYYWGVSRSLGFCYKKNEQYNEAIKAFSKAIELYPEKYKNEFLFQRGLCYEINGQCDEAIKDYTKTIELDNLEKEAFLHRGRIYFENKNYKKAFADFDEYLKLDPDNVEVQYDKRFAEILARK